MTAVETTLRRATRAGYEDALRAIIARIREHPDAPLNLAEMAGVANVSRCHLDRIFRRVTGLTPRQFQTALRLREATRLLLTTQRSVTDICFDVGYTSLGSFVTRFTNTLTVSPQRLRLLAPALDQTLDAWLPERPPLFVERPVVRGRVAHARPDSVTFVGIFSEPIAAQAPLACAIAGDPPLFAMSGLARGSYHLMAVSLRRSDRAIDVLMNDDLPRAAMRIEIGGGTIDVVVALRERWPLDPPIQLVLPLLLRLMRK